MEELKGIESILDAEGTKVSVIVPVYNSEKTLVKCIDSIINQTMTDIEIICVNAGSTDSSLEILKDLAKKDSRIKIINEKNIGYVNAVNIGIDAAEGEYISIVESKDFIAPSMYENLYLLSLFGNVDVIKGNYWNYYVSKNQPPKFVVNNERNIESSENPFTLKENPQILEGCPSIWSGIYNLEFLNKNGIRLKEDKENEYCCEAFYYATSFLYDVLSQAETIMWTKEPVYYHLTDKKSDDEETIKNKKLKFEEIQREKDKKLEKSLIKKYNKLLTLVKFIKNNYPNDSAIKRYVYNKVFDYVYIRNYGKNSAEFTNQAKELMRQLDGKFITSEYNTYDQLTYYTYVSPLKTLKAKSKNILIYNWLPFDNPWGWGGGVTVYCKNIIEEMLKSDPTVNIYFLSSGFAYNANTTDIFVRKIGNMFGERVHQYEVVNSPVPAEQRNLYVNPLVALENPRLKKVIKNFIEDYGEFQAIHFNNIEGLSLDVLDLKEEYPNTKFIFSIHNYVPLCVNGSYYMRHKHCNCNPDHTGVDCFKCTRADIRSNLDVETYKRGLYGIRPEECISQGRWIKSFGFERLAQDVSTDDILDFAKTATAKLNKNCDDILAVSKRVYDIAADNGFDKSKMHVSYIGTKVADRQIGYAASKPTNGLKLVFLGSDINYEEKGYPFLLDTLAELEEKYASKIDLVLTVKQTEHAEIYTMCSKFRSLKVIQGYTHADLENIFSGCNLSIVPVLWEDNLPQIAIESVAYGVPVLASSAGGASELCDSDLFKFECGNSDDMLDKIKHFVDNPEDLEEYWKNHHGLVTMTMHWEELAKFYGLSEETATIELSYEDYQYLLKENQFLHDHVSWN